MNLTEPLLRTSPMIARNVVVLPAPFAPISVTISPSRTEMLILWSTSTPSGYAALTSRTSSNCILNVLRHAALTEISADHFRISADSFRHVISNFLAEIENGNAIRDLHHKRHVVLDDQNGDADGLHLLNISDQPLDLGR